MGSANSKTTYSLKQKSVPTFKVVLIGEPNVGKTSILNRYAKHQFNEEYRPSKSVRIENVVKKINLPNDIISSVTLWDLPGSEDVDLRDKYYMDVDAAIVVVDLTDETSIELAGSWKQDFVNRTSKTKLVSQSVKKGVDTTYLQKMPCDGQKIPVLLLGNKYDLVDDAIWQGKLNDDMEEEAQHPDDYITSTMPKSVQRAAAKSGQEKSDDTEDNDDIEDQSEQDFAPILGPKKNEKKPACVTKLENVEAQFGFVGSVMVSAKTGDHSVHMAVQHLVRYLLEGKIPGRAGVKKRKKRKIEVDKEEFKSPMEETGEKQFDELFTRCSVPLRRCGEYIVCYEHILKRFKEKCAQCGMLTDPRPSLEDCILGTRRCLQQLGEIDLKAIEDDGFVYVEHTFNHRVKIPREVPMVIDFYNKEFAPVCRAILRDCPQMDEVLGRLDDKIIKQCEDIKELMPQATDAQHARVVNICDKNRARIAFARKQIHDTIEKAVTAAQKTKAACMW